MPWCPCGFIIAVYLDLSSSRGGGFFCGLSLPLQGRWHAERDGEVVTNLRQPLSQPAADSSPGRGAFARCGGGNLSGAARQLPLTRGALGAGGKASP